MSTRVLMARLVRVRSARVSRSWPGYSGSIATRADRTTAAVVALNLESKTLTILHYSTHL